jgi:flagellar biosynthetic protein FliQ
LLIALAVGLTIGIIQAATSINEMTLSFVPKLVLVTLAFGMLSTYMLTQLSDFFGFIFDTITQIS